MERRSLALATLTAVIVLTAGLASAGASQPNASALIKISLIGDSDLARVEAAGVPVYARLTGGGESYLLAGASPEEIAALQSMPLDVDVLDASPGGASHYLVLSRSQRQLSSLPPRVRILSYDGVQTLIRATQADAEMLAAEELEITALSLEPITLLPRHGEIIPKTIEPDPLVASMITQVDQTELYQYEEWLTGEEPAMIGGVPYTITTRHTYSGEPVEKATQFVGEHLAVLGLDVEYHSWNASFPPNVIATKPGLVDPDRIFIICAHLDDMPAGEVAPGADDNGSGSAAVLVVSHILSQFEFGCTLKFAFWTGEEQGMLGSNAWASRASGEHLNILGVLNMDMIAYNSDDAPFMDIHARSWLPDSVAMANLFADIVDAYSLEVVPEVLIDDPLGNYSDNGAFWDRGYTAILAIEDEDDFSPHYHTVDDRLSTLNLDYFAQFVRASLGTFVHASDCLIPDGIGYLEGHVTAASRGDAIANAPISIGHATADIGSISTDGSGYYTRTLPTGSYTLTVQASGYVSQSVGGLRVSRGQVTTQDFALRPLAIYLPLCVR
ncbi:MAG: M28 family peptidase [Ardenticatenales bacterium]|nr:M28 family peptidase [Ardenticatenales bacterium]